MNIFITGGAGFIGSHLCEFHLKKGDVVHALDDLSTGSEDNIKLLKENKQFTFFNEDILKTSRLEEEAKWADIIYHMAAVVGVAHVLQHPIDVLNVNINGCANVLNAIANSGSKAKIIIASSSSVYGALLPPPQAENNNLIIDAELESLWNYGLSKMANEVYALSYFREQQLPVIIVRLFNCIGPRQTGRYGMVVPRFIKAALRNEPLQIFGDGFQTRSFCDVRDTVAMLNLLTESDNAAGQIINVGNNNEISINDLAKLIIHITASKSEIAHVPYQEAYGESIHDIKNRQPDLSKLNRLIEFKHQWTLEDTIRDLMKHQPVN